MSFVVVIRTPHEGGGDESGATL